MSTGLRVVTPGFAVSLQDRGRTGLRHLGVPLSGALDPWLMSAANALVGNQSSDAVLEVGLDGPTLEAVGEPVQLALCGEITARSGHTGPQESPLPAWRTMLLQPGERIKISGARQGVAYLAVSGGVRVPPVLGSRSTTMRAGIGGLHGRHLVAGDWLPCLPTPSDAPHRFARQPWPPCADTVRVLAGPQQDHFSAQALQVLQDTAWRVGRDMDRMGLRLTGGRLEHSELGANIVSDAVLPGAIQVPASGEPLVLMPDCQTTGGYPKLATVIAADLPCLARVRPGDTLRFRCIEPAQAREALHQRAQAHQRWLSGIVTLAHAGDADESALYHHNLISGAVWHDD